MISLNRSDIFEPGWEGDPTDLIEDFFADLEEEVQETCLSETREWKSAGQMYFQNLAHCRVTSPSGLTGARAIDHKSSTTSTASPDFPHQLILDMSGHLNEKNKSAQTGDVDTITTVDESLDLGSLARAASDDEDGSHDFDAGESSGSETVKEQSKRLLTQHRKSQSQSVKPKRIKLRITGLRTIEEEHRIDGGSGTTKADTVESLNVKVGDDSTDDDRRRTIQLFLDRKFKPSVRARKDASRKRRKPVKSRPLMNVFLFADWRDVVRLVPYCILLFSSPAARYAMFRSLRRFKPGD